MVATEALAANHYNLSPSAYVETVSPAQHRDIQTILAELAHFDAEALRLDGDVKRLFTSLGYPLGVRFQNDTSINPAICSC